MTANGNAHVRESERSERERPTATALLSPQTAVVTALATTPVKGLRIVRQHRLALTRAGAPENRRFYLIDELSQMVNGKRLGVLAAVRADYDTGTGRLTLIFPDGAESTGIVRIGDPVETRFFSRTPTAHLVTGPWAEALSSYSGAQLRLVESDPAEGGVDRGPAGAVSLVSRASITKLEGLAGRSVDPRRFRMLIEIDGVEAHQEDEWVGHTVRIGAVRVAIRGHVGRCLVTSQSPDSGIVDLPTLDLLSYRRRVPTTERLAFGVFGEVLEPGLVTIGDRVSPE